MQKLLCVLICGLVFSGCSLMPKKSGIEIMSYPPAKVFINGKESGMTPYKNMTLKPGEVEVELQTADYKWSRKITLNNNINTVIDWEMGKEEKLSGGYVLYMEKTGDSKKAGLLINSSPDKTAAAIDNEIQGFSPLRIDNVAEGDRQITLSFPGYKTVNVFVKAMAGYQLIVEAKLIAEEVDVAPTPTPGAVPTVVNNISTVIIKATETGWLRVRDQASSGGVEVAKVKPNERYPLLEENSGWYRIDLGNGKTGWVSIQYATKE